MNAIKALLCSVLVGGALGQPLSHLGHHSPSLAGRSSFSSSIDLGPRRTLISGLGGAGFRQRQVDFLHGNLQLDAITGRSPGRISPGRVRVIGGRSLGRGGGGVRRIIGSTIHGRQLRPGDIGLPRHGGAGAGPSASSGLMQGWDGNPMNLGNIHDPWSDPLHGRAIPTLPEGFGGDWGRLGLTGFGPRRLG